MDELNEKKENNRKKEFAQSKLLWKHQQRLMDDYYVAASERNLDEVQFGYNVSMLMEILQDWQDKIDEKNRPDQHKKLSKMRMACVEMLTHQMSLRQKLSFSIVESKKWRDQWKIQADKVKLLEEQIKAINAQNQFNAEN